MTLAVELVELDVRYAARRAVRDVDLRVERGTALGVVGANGSGKSTLLKTVAGLIAPAAGAVRVLGRAPRRNPPGTIAYVPQIELVDWSFPATVGDVVGMGRFCRRRFYQRFSARDRAVVDEALEALDLGPLRDRRISALSGGQQQRVFLARALAQEPEIFLLDEPTTGVDAETEEALCGLVRSLVASGRTVLMSTHDVESVERWFDRVIVVDGTIVAEGTPEQIRARPQRPLADHGHGHRQRTSHA